MRSENRDKGRDGQPPVVALSVFDDGRGSALYAGGRFTSSGEVPVDYIAKWDGASWSEVGGGMGAGQYAPVAALSVFDDGTGPALYVGGRFYAAGDVSARYVARWDGYCWSALRDGLNGWVYALGDFDDGSGPVLFVGGDFTMAGQTPSFNIARWRRPIQEP